MGNQFISVVSRGSNKSNWADTLVFTALSNNVDPEVSFTFSVVLDGTEADEKAIARKIYKACLAALNTQTKLYGGASTFSKDVPAFTFRPLLCDHVVNLWSQAEFSISMASSKAVSVNIGEVPTFATASDFCKLADALGVIANPLSGGSLNNDQVNAGLEAASALAYSITGKLICAATYLHEESGGGGDGMTLEQTKILFVDQRQTDSPDVTLLQWDLKLDNTARETGVVSFETAGIGPMDVWGAGDVGHFIMITYAAGYTSIPSLLRREVVRLVGAQLMPNILKAMKIGTMNVNFGDYKVIRQEMEDNLQILAW